MKPLHLLPVLLLLLAASALADPLLPPQLAGVGVAAQPGAQVPLGLRFRDESGRAVQLGDYFGPRPVILSLAYYGCPMLCSEVLGGLASSLRALSLVPGADFTVLTVSFDPRDSAAVAADRKRATLARYPRPGASAAWHFLTGDEAAIRALTGAVGFHYSWDAQLQQYAHAAAIYVLTPGGRVSQVLSGIEFAPRALRLDLVDASGGRIGSFIDHVVLFCYRYDPTRGRSGAAVMAAVRIGGALTVAALALFIAWMLRREARG